MISDETRTRLLNAMDEYAFIAGGHYDEVFEEIQSRISSCGSAGKLDIAGVACWKRSAQGAWLGDLNAVGESQVRAITAEAFAAVSDGEALRVLAALPGFASQEAIPTALLATADSYRWGVMDRRALTALADLGYPVNRSRGLTVRYLEEIREIRDCLSTADRPIMARDVDKALFVLGGRR